MMALFALLILLLFVSDFLISTLSFCYINHNFWDFYLLCVFLKQILFSPFQFSLSSNILTFWPESNGTHYIYIDYVNYHEYILFVVHHHL